LLSTGFDAVRRGVQLGCHKFGCYEGSLTRLGGAAVPGGLHRAESTSAQVAQALIKMLQEATPVSKSSQNLAYNYSLAETGLCNKVDGSMRAPDCALTRPNSRAVMVLPSAPSVATGVAIGAKANQQSAVQALPAGTDETSYSIVEKVSSSKILEGMASRLSEIVPIQSHRFRGLIDWALRIHKP